ncbi:hypothetical protein [Phenylobacterium montanum]|uniref:Uncharacterized protein n=1 Tax=Phenylobacterium montanum TaxID=2823693 RepID=A0A975FW13_9CAUL|nr:hypothetical protein [Caulobacter sp. S6]QUD86181.1 hypothetical protein KCG34_13835 [Caulobacter sp. S6]
MRILLRILFLFFVSPFERLDLSRLFESRAFKRRRLRSIRGGYLADVGDDDPLP